MKWPQFIFPALLLSSCISYQHITIESDLPVEKSSNRYYQESNGIKITFDFEGENFPVQANIYNQTDSTLYVDLSKTSFTVNNEVVKTGLAKKEVKFEGVIDTLGLNPLEFPEVNGTIILPENREILAIPPGAFGRFTHRPFPAKYDPQKKSWNNEEEMVSVGAVERKTMKYTFPKDSRILGVNYFVSFDPNGNDAYYLRADFREKYLYNINSSSINLEKPPAQRYHVLKRDKTGGVLLGSTLIVVGLIAGASDFQ